jgi:hypothetical protein
MGDWDDESEEEEEIMSPSAGGASNDPFGDEDEDSDDDKAWDDSSEEEDESAPKKAAGPTKGIKEIAREKRQKEQDARRLALKAERMELAIRAGRGAKTGVSGSAGAAAAKPDGPIGPIGEDGFERRTDPSDGVGYTFLEYLDAYGQEGENLWEVAGAMMMGQGGGLGSVQADSDMLFGGDDAISTDAGAPSSGAVTLDEAIKYELMARSEFDTAAEALASKFEQLIVSDNFIPFLGKWCTAMMAECKSEAVGELIAEMTRVQNAAAKAGPKKGGTTPKGSAPARGLAAEGASMADMGAGGKKPSAAKSAAPLVKKKSKKNFSKLTMGEAPPQGAAEDDFSESMDAFM